MQYDLAKGLPEPDALSAAHSENVAAHIREKIASSGGAISFAQFMHEALYAPGLGYYSAGSTKFGAAGDFVTAPEVSRVFGRVVARQCAEILTNLDGGGIIEFGAGSGKLAVDMLQMLHEMDTLPSAYSILEVSPDLRQRQQQFIADALPHLLHRVEWIDDVPQAFTGIYLANEVLDAIPVERVVQQDALQRQTVVLEGDRFVFGLQDVPAHLQVAAKSVQDDIGRPFAADYVSEIGVAAQDWLSVLAGSLRQGAIFLFDYGVSRREYYAEDRNNGWLRCHFRHHAHSDPLILPGIQDVTAWVDFSAMAAAAVANDLDILGYQSQAEFLLGGGLEAEMRDFENLEIREQLRLSAAIKTLTLPGEMGENFKCMALGRGEVGIPSAFQRADRTHTL